MKKIKFMNKDRNGKRCECGFMEIKNQTEDSADLFFYGDIAARLGSPVGMRTTWHRVT